ncbi:multisubunit sodium/proton antiporter, MrpF subunit [Thermomonospora echinospora]|uniref:Multisubunit sodium/proton antiporter, MrpF subunit n=1 Tax=Thermomonospora echinospora TaxID=1992 RepID=A0A1H6C813_9ACTN|nr:monovalent cation/H+ antiporter complex subunit F [Thermomonospora echinospora]SEG69120.1 multisubunit sodium/proton antiporter, MrpF subunit [Thermomonospora echinospora]
MNAVYAVTLGLLSVAALLTLVRLLRGPTVLDRILALDVLSVLLVGGVGVRAAMLGSTADVASLVVIALLGFAGTVTAARLAAERGRPE